MLTRDVRPELQPDALVEHGLCRTFWRNYENLWKLVFVGMAAFMPGVVTAQEIRAKIYCQRKVKSAHSNTHPAGISGFETSGTSGAGARFYF